MFSVAQMILHECGEASRNQRMTEVEEEHLQ